MIGGAWLNHNKLSQIMRNENLIAEIKTLAKFNTKSYGEDYAQYQRDVTGIVDLFKDRLEIEKRNIIYVVDVNDKVVSRRLAAYCAYIDNKYVGKVYLDKQGNIFGSIADVKEKYGDTVVFSTVSEQNHNYQYGSMAECVYVPEIECILIASKDYSNCANIASINDNNDHVDSLNIGEPRYALITKDLLYISDIGTPKHLSYVYYRANKIYGMMDAVKQLLDLDVGVVNVGGNRYIPLDNVQNLIEYSKYKAKLAYKSGKVQKKIDELVAMKEFDTNPMPNRMPHEYENLVCKTHINKIDKNISVIRWSYSYRDEGFDGMRVYIEGNEVYACKRNNQGQFIKVALSTLNQKNFSSEYASDIEADDMTGTKLEWYTSIVNTIPDKHRMTLLITFLNDVRIEQLVKLGMCDSICYLLENNNMNISHAIRQILKVNAAEEDSKNIYRWMGINKRQFNQIVDMCKKSDRSDANALVFYAIGEMKALFNAQDISHFDNQLFDNMLSAYSFYFDKYFGRASYYSIDPYAITTLLTKADSADNTGAFKNNMLHYVPTILNISEWSRAVFHWYQDLIGMVCKMNIRQQVKLYPTTKEDLRQMHDSVSAVYNMHKSQYQREAFVSRVADLKKMEYENDDFEFCVKVPEKPEDLAVEGLELHHCVKSYIDRVCDGRTNILFIRKKDDVTKPFFTVELTNDRVVAQVHGFANRNADTEPNMVDFVERWARNKRLKLGAFNSVRG